MQGVSLAPGVAFGRACQLFTPPPRRRGTGEDLGDELRRLDEALSWMSQRLESLASEAAERIDQETADVFRAHRLMLEDPALRQRLFEAAAGDAEGGPEGAERAVETQLERYRAQLLEAGCEYLRERASDIAQLKRDLMERLRSVVPYRRCSELERCSVAHCQLGNDHVLVARELTPGLAIEVDCHTRGFVVAKGGKASHAAILAKALGLPAVSGLRDLADHVALHMDILVLGDSGEVVLNPSAGTLDRYRPRAGAGPPVVPPVAGLAVMANIDLPAGVDDAVVARAEGVGLYRTEIEVLARGGILSESQQAARYEALLAAMAEQPVYVRLLDLGADKCAGWLGLAPEANPALGLRGARLLLAHPELVRTQARALARAARNRPIRVVYPMISAPEQFLHLRRLFLESIADLPPARLEHGVMFEVPSACLQAEEILAEADFGCIGTNDLVQYLFAADRDNLAIDSEALLASPVLWRLIEAIAAAGRRHGKPISLCGELGADPRYTQRIVEAGVDAVSVSPAHVAAVRRAIPTPAGPPA